MTYDVVFFQAPSTPVPVPATVTRNRRRAEKIARALNAIPGAQARYSVRECR